MISKTSLELFKLNCHSCFLLGQFTDPFCQPYLGITKLESEANRMVPKQPLEFTEKTVHHQAKRLPYNLRKLSELPYHLVKSRRISDLKQEVFFNYHWLSTKLKAMSLHDILSDFRCD